MTNAKGVSHSELWVGMAIAWLIAAAMMMFIAGPRQILEGHKAFGWQKQTGRVVESTFKTIDSKQAVLSVTVGYDFRGSSYQSVRELQDKPEYLRNQSELFIKAGEKIDLRVNPLDPSQIMLDKEYFAFEFVWIVGSVLTVILLVVGIGWSAWIDWRDRPAALKLSALMNQSVIVFGCLFVLVFCGIATFRGYSDAVKEFKMLSWVKTEATIQTCDISKVRHGESWDWKTDFAFTYTFEGQTYTGQRWALRQDEVTTGKEMRQAMQAMKPGDIVQCYVNPCDPSQVIIQRRLASHYGLVPLTWLLLLCAGYLVTTLPLKKKKAVPSFKLAFEGDPDELQEQEWEQGSLDQLTELPFRLQYELNRRQRLLPHFMGVWPIWPLMVLVILIVPLVLQRYWWFVFVLPLAAWAIKGFFVGLLDALIHPIVKMDVVVEKDRLGIGGLRGYRFLGLRTIIDVNKYEHGTWTLRFHNGVVINIPDGVITDRQILYIVLASREQKDEDAEQ